MVPIVIDMERNVMISGSRSLALATFASIIIVGSASAEELKIEGAGISRDIACNGEDVGIYGADHKIELTGTCGAIIVHGSGSTVRFEAGKNLHVSGVRHDIQGGSIADLIVETSENTVKAIIRPASGEEGSVDVAGVDHEIALDLAGPVSLDVRGVRNSLAYSLIDGAPKPMTSSSGALNEIKGK